MIVVDSSALIAILDQKSDAAMAQYSDRCVQITSSAVIPLCCVLFVWSPPANSSPQNQRPKSGRPMQEMDLASKISALPSKKVRLTADEINAELAGKRLDPDPNVKQLAFLFTEKFYPDGTWIMWREERYRRRYQGSWSIKNDQLCVKSEKEPVQCRDVWRVGSGSRLFIEDFSRLALKAGPIRVVTRPLD